MNADNIKRLALCLVIGALACVLVWKIVPLVNPAPVAPAKAKLTPGPRVPQGAVLVTVSMVGFDPDVIEAKAGQPLQLAFFRPNDANCGREVVFPDLGITKALPPGETVVVELTPPRTGPLVFECGMKMLKGQLIVR